MTKLSPHVADFIKPLSEATTLLLAEDRKLYATDRLHVSVVTPWGQDNRRFEMQAYCVQHNGDDDISSMSHAHYQYRQYPSGYAENHWWQKIPGAQLSNSNRGCYAPISDTSALVALAVWGKNKITFEDEEARLEFWTRVGAFMRGQKTAEYQAQFKETHLVPDHAPMGKEGLPPMPHQRVAAMCLLESDAYSLFMEMRTGKTYSVIMAMDEDSEKNPHALNMIVCPKNVRVNWEREIALFSNKRVKVITLRRHKINRMKLMLEAFEFREDYDYTVVLISYEGMSSMIPQLSAFTWRWGVLDESHYIKQSRTKRFQAAKQIRESCAKRVCLTGTPICNSAFDLYSQFEWLNEGHSGFASFEAFRAFYGKFDEVNTPTSGYKKFLVGMQNMPLLQERISRSSFLITKKEALPDLPPMTNKVLEVEMTDYQKQVYNEVATSLYAEIERDLESSEKGTITINNILTKLLRLAQVAAGFVALDGEIDLDTGEVLSRQIDRIDPNPKLDMLVEYLKEKEFGSKTIVWACFIPALKQIRARLEMEGIECVTLYGKTKGSENQEAMDRFNTDPKVQVYLSNPTKGGIGVNLNGRILAADGTRISQCDSMVYYCQGWSSPVRLQSQARPQDKTCDWSIEVVDMCAEDSIDFEILERVFGKVEHAMAVQDIRAILKRLVVPT